MVNYTNFYKYPDFVEYWLKTESYDYQPGTISMTTLLMPPKAYGLRLLYKDDLEIDVDDLIASRLGNAIHDSFEKAKIPNCEQEKRLYYTVNDKVVTGKFDILRNIDKPIQRLTDVKSTSVWTYIYGSRDDDFRKQVSGYRYLATKDGYNVDEEADICYVFTDWSKARSVSDENYPKSRILVKPLKLMPLEEIEAFIKQRVDLCKSMEGKTQEEMPNCTIEELWQSESTWALMKDGRKSAVRLFESKIEAENYIKEKDLDTKIHHIDERKGKVRRCDYCVVSKHCKQYKEMQIAGIVE